MANGLPPTLAEVAPIYRSLRERGVPDHIADTMELWQVADVFGLGADDNLNGAVLNEDEFLRQARKLQARKVAALKAGGEAALEQETVEVPAYVLAGAAVVDDAALEQFRARKRDRRAPVEDT